MELCHQQGFTLLELLISITLMAVIVTIMAMVFRTAVTAYERRTAVNRMEIPVESMRGLLERQLAGVLPVKDPLHRRYSRFEGDEETLVFVTRVSPMGAAQGGMFLVCYTFLADRGLMAYMQHLVVRPEDAWVEIPRVQGADDAPGLLEDGWVVDFVPVRGVKFSYLGRGDGVSGAGGEEMVSPEPVLARRPVRRPARYPDAVTLTLELSGGRSITWRFFMEKDLT